MIQFQDCMLPNFIIVSMMELESIGTMAMNSSGTVKMAEPIKLRHKYSVS